MKRKLSLKQLIIASIAILLILGCSKKDDSITPTPTPKPITTIKDTLNYVKLDGKKYAIENANILHSPQFAGVGGCHYYYLYLGSKGVYFSTFFNTMKGSGDALNLNLLSSSPTNYFGTYNVDTNNIGEPWEMYGGFIINGTYSFFPTPGTVYSYYRGSFTIAKITNDTTLITSTGKTSDNKIINVYYKGILSSYEVEY
jgi:hypothetical protein